MMPTDAVQYQEFLCDHQGHMFYKKKGPVQLYGLL